MRKLKTPIVFLSVLTLNTGGCKGQPASGLNKLRLEKEIALPSVKGRIDHMDVNAKAGILYVAALGNNTLEIVDLLHGKRIHGIGGLDEPQGVGYIAETDEILVANGGTGDCFFFSARTFEKTATVHLHSDADDVRYDPTARKVYVGYGAGGIAIIDANTHKQIGDIKLPAHPEGFQIDRASGRMLVNVPDAHMIGVIDLKQSKLVAQWNTGRLSANFPMAVDLENHRLFVGYRHPARLAVLDSRSGAVLSTTEMTSDADDLYYDGAAGRVYVSGGGGAIDIFQAKGTELKQISHIPTRSGARTSLLITLMHAFVLAERAEGGRQAQLALFSTE